MYVYMLVGDMMQEKMSHEGQIQYAYRKDCIALHSINDSLHSAYKKDLHLHHVFYIYNDTYIIMYTDTDIYR